MLFLAVNLGLALLSPNQQQVLLDDPVWKQIKPSLATINGVGGASGIAVLVDSRGYFLMHRSAVTGDSTVVTFGLNDKMTLRLSAVDEQTQLAVFRADGWNDMSTAPVRVNTGLAVGAKLIAATTSGPVHGEFVSGDRVGQIKATLRYTPLSEIRLESTKSKIGGAIVFDEAGQLVGILGATLSNLNSANDAARNLNMGTGLAKSNPPKSNETKTSSDVFFGPQGLTVAYSLGPKVIQRVVDGLLSPDHKVKHPSIGIFFKNSENGPIVEEVLKDSPAFVAGVHKGDIVTTIDGTEVSNSVELAMTLFNFTPGQRITMTVMRNGQELTMTMTIGVQDSLS